MEQTLQSKRPDDEEGEDAGVSNDQKQIAKNAKRREAFLKDLKCIVHYRNVGSAPSLKTAKYKVAVDAPFHTVSLFLRGLLKLKPSDPLLLYVNAAFAPSPTDCVADLFQCFNQSQELVIFYSTTPAYG